MGVYYLRLYSRGRGATGGLSGVRCIKRRFRGDALKAFTCLVNCKPKETTMTDKNSSEGKFELKVSKNTTPEEAARLALIQEQKARRYYEECAKIMQNPGAKKMFEFLAEEERKHETLIQKEIDENFLMEM